MLEDLRATNHAHVAHVLQVGRDRFRDPGADPVVGRIPGHVGERQDGDGALARLHVDDRPDSGRASTRLESAGRVTQGILHVARGVVPRHRRFLQRAADDVLDVKRNRRIELRQRRRLLTEDLIEDDRQGVAAKRQGAGQHLVEHHAKGPEIDTLIDRIAAQLLGRHIRDRAEHHARRGDQNVRLRQQIRFDRGRHVQLRQAEVEHLHQSAPRLNQVGALDVTVGDATAVRLVQRFGHLRGDVHGIGHRQRPSSHALRDQLAIDVLHGDEHRVLVFDQVVGDGDVRRLQERRGLRFAEEARPAVGVPAAIGRKELQRDLTPEPPVVGHVDFAHPARAKPWADLIVEDAGARQGRRRHANLILIVVVVPLDALMSASAPAVSTRSVRSGQADDAGVKLVRRLGFWSSIGLVIGITIGSGIFRTPSVIATRVPDPVLMLAVWVFGGLISLCGALSVAELAASLPRTGGWFVYLREGWGRLAGFLFGWSELVLIRASATGAVATVFSEYLQRSLGYDPATTGLTNIIAAGAIVFSAAVNIRGAHVGAAFAGVSTVAKFSALACLTLAAFLVGGPDASFVEFHVVLLFCRCRTLRSGHRLRPVGVRRLRRPRVRRR